MGDYVHSPSQAIGSQFSVADNGTKVGLHFPLNLRMHERRRVIAEGGGSAHMAFENPARGTKSFQCDNRIQHHTTESHQGILRSFSSV